MRIITAATIGIVAMFHAAASTAEETIVEPKAAINHLDSDELPLDLELSTTVIDTDPIVTGGTISSDYLTSWEYQSTLYEECPECVANQPFPGD